MSAEVVNLRRARKAAARDRHDDEAAAARARHGRTRAERDGERLEAQRAGRHLDGARLDAASPRADDV